MQTLTEPIINMIGMVAGAAAIAALAISLPDLIMGTVIQRIAHELGWIDYRDN